MNVGELKELIEDIESEWDEEMMGSFDLTPIYYMTNTSARDGYLVESDVDFLYTSNCFIVDVG